MSRNKSLVLQIVSCFSAAPSDPTLLSGSCSQDLHYIYPGITVLTDPPSPPPVSFTTVSMVTRKTVLLSLLLHCSFHPKQPSPLIKIPLLYLGHDALHIPRNDYLKRLIVFAFPLPNIYATTVSETWWLNLICTLFIQEKQSFLSLVSLLLL